MRKYREIDNYLKTIDSELADVEPGLKRSIIQEIEEHLNEKIKELTKTAKKSKLSGKSIEKILHAFGEPKEIASEYRRQLSEEQVITPTVDRKSKSKKWIVVTIIIIGLLLCAIIPYFILRINDDNEEEPKEVFSGPWLQAVAWKPGGDYCLIVGEGMQITKYDGENYQTIGQPRNIHHYDVAWHPSGDYALICGSGGTILKYDEKNLTDISFQIDENLSAIKFSSDGQYALCVGSNNFIGMVQGNQTNYRYIPQDIAGKINFYDLAWHGDDGSCLLVGYDTGAFMKGIMIKYTPGPGAGECEFLNGTYTLLQTQEPISTCFSAAWVEEWSSYIVTGNMGQFNIIHENWTTKMIYNPYSNIDPILDAVWNPVMKRVILVGGLAGWNEAQKVYDPKISSRQVMSCDGEMLEMINSTKGPHFLSCEWNPKDQSVIMVGSFRIAYKYKDGKVSPINVEF